MQMPRTTLTYLRKAKTSNGCRPDGKMPLLLLRDKAKWPHVSCEFKKKGVFFSKAKNIDDGIKIFPTTVADFRAMTKLFQTQNIPLYMYQLPCEELLNVVIRNGPVESREDGIRND